MPTPLPTYKRHLKLILKLGLTGLAIYLVFRQLDLGELQQIMLQANWAWLIPAFFLFLISKLLSAFRLLIFYNCIGLKLDRLYNIKLYLIGMFYNLFLPGGIGGDGYKVLVLRKANSASTRNLIFASLLDRVSGLAAIIFLALGSAIFSQFYLALGNMKWIFWVGTLSVFPIYYVVIYWLFPKFRPIAMPGIYYSLLIQVFIYGTVITLLYTINVRDHLIEYYALFMISAIAASVPFTVGGIGVREAVLVFLPQLIDTPITKDTAVALSLLFLMITLFTSLLGVFFDVDKPILKETNLKSSSA